MKSSINLSQEDNIFIKKCLEKYYTESKFLDEPSIDAVMDGKDLSKISGGHNLDFSVVIQDVANIVQTLGTIISLYLAVKSLKKEEIIVIIKNEIDKTEILELMEEDEKEGLINDIFEHTQRQKEGE